MKKSIFKKLGGLFLGLAMAVGVGVAVASNSEAVPVHAAGKDDWVQVTALSGLNTTDTYVIANDADKGYFMNGTVSSGHFQSTAFGASAPASASVAGAFKFEAVNASSNIYKIKLVSTSKYVTASKAGSGGGKVSDTSDSAGWKFLLSGTSFNAIYQTAYSGKYAAMRCYNNTSWRTYSNNSATSISVTNGTVFRLYKYQTATLSSISVKTAPTKTSYVQGEYFDPTGLVITRTYSDSSTSDHTYAGHTSDFTFSPTTSTALTTSHTSVTITYGGKTCNQAITVSAPKTPGSLSSTGQTTSFEAGDTFTYGGTSTVTYTDSTSKSVTPSSFKIGNAGINPTSAGTVITPGTTILNRDDHHGKTVYVLYTENATTVYTSYTISVAAVSKVTFTGGIDTGSATGQGKSDSLTKSGVTMACDSCYTTSGAYRFYSGSTLTISSTVGNIAQIEFNMNGSYNSNLLSTSTGTYNSSDSAKGIWTGDAASIDFDLSAQARVDSIVITLASNDPTVELDATSATSVDMLDGDTDLTVKILAKNIDDYTAWALTFDEDGDTGLSSSDYVTVVPGAFSNNVSTFAITAKKVGSTILNIQLDGTDCEDTVEITIGQKPASITITHGDVYEKDNKLQLDLKAGGTYKQMTFSGKDIRGDTYAVAAADVTPSIQSGSSYVAISGTRITPTSTAGTAVVRYTLNDLDSVYVELTVNVISDRNLSVNDNGITYVASASGVQGEPLKVSDIISATSTTTLFGETGTIADGEYLFAYSNNRSIAVGLGNFVYEITDDTLDVGETENREIFVFVSFDESYVSSTHVDIKAADRPLTAISLDTGASLSLNRNKSHQLEVSYTPYNTTSTRAVAYAITASSSESSITVSDSGLISAGSKIGSTATIKVTSQFSADIYASVNVTVTREAITITYDISEEWVETNGSDLAVGDQVILTGVKEGVTYAAGTYPDSGNNVPADTTNKLTVSGTKVTGVVKTMIYTLEEGTVDGSVAFKDSSGKYLYAASSSGNNMKSQDKIDANASFTIDASGNVVATESSNRNRMRYNNSSTSNLFNCYGNDNTGTKITFYKLTGGSDTITVGDDLFNDLMDYYYSGDFFECAPNGATFDGDGWNEVGEVLADYKGTYKLNYARANASGNEVEQFLATYDYVVAKYGVSYDYLGRIASGKVAPTSPRINPILALSNVDNSVWVISAVALVGLTAIGGYFFYRKRKEN